ncbi:hypothetical protein Y1Q_0007989 [Alligator mississippiensis]|uniref:Uncharacterized protein n=1 Tax=Alligator mississippiensis TaxID=8496 RepID=A0A151NFH9_ALLMI|nr:hypothetical protein Y1Q_0007989 [Alligator mississippiensis]
MVPEELNKSLMTSSRRLFLNLWHKVKKKVTSVRKWSNSKIISCEGCIYDVFYLSRHVKWLLLKNLMS